MKRLALILVLLLGACSPPLEKGVVLAKDYDSEWVQIVPIQTGNITTYTTVIHPETYKLLIAGEREGKPVDEWVTVSFDKYKQCEKDDLYPECETPR